MTTMMMTQAYPVALERIQKWRHMSGVKRQKFFVMPLHFLALQVGLQLVDLVTLL